MKLAAVITRVGHIELNEGEGEAVFEWGRGGVLELLSAISLAVMDLLAWLLLGGADKAEERRVAEKARKARKWKRRRASGQAEARFAAELEARAVADAEAKAKVNRSTKRAEAKAKEKGDPETVEQWANSKNVILGPSHVVPQSAAYDDYAADCKAHGQTPTAKVAGLPMNCGSSVSRSHLSQREARQGVRLGTLVTCGSAGLRVVSSR